VAFPAVRRRSLATTGFLDGRSGLVMCQPNAASSHGKDDLPAPACPPPPSVIDVRPGGVMQSVCARSRGGWISILKSADFDGGAEGYEDERVSIRARRHHPQSRGHPRGGSNVPTSPTIQSGLPRPDFWPRQAGGRSWANIPYCPALATGPFCRRGLIRSRHWPICSSSLHDGAAQRSQGGVRFPTGGNGGNA